MEQLVGLCDIERVGGDRRRVEHVVDIAERPGQRGRLAIAVQHVRATAQFGGQVGIAQHQPPAVDRGLRTRRVRQGLRRPHNLVGPLVEEAAALR